MAAKEKRIGRQTPTKSFVLPYERSLSAGAVEIYERTGRKVLEWQKKLLQDIMAVNPDGQWTHMTVGYSVPRRNGKTEDVYMRELWGLMHGEKIAHTAHRNSTSHSSFEAMKSLLEAMGLQDKEDFISNRALGNERIDLVESGGRIQYRTRTGQGGLGEGFDLLVIDEAQEYTDTHQSALRYTITSSQNPQTIMLGTPPTAVSKGTVFQPFREKCLYANEGFSDYVAKHLYISAPTHFTDKVCFENYAYGKAADGSRYCGREISDTLYLPTSKPAGCDAYTCRIVSGLVVETTPSSAMD